MTASAQHSEFDQYSISSPPPVAMMGEIKAKLGRVKLLPEVAVRALEIARDPDASIQDFARVVQQDLNLATGVLSMANSSLFSAGKPTTVLAQGISRIGLRQCRNIVISSSLASAIRQISFQEQWIRELLWQHSVVTSFLATHLNRELGLGFDGVEFTAGLIHDLGRTLLAVTYPDRFGEFDNLDFQESRSTVEREIKALGCCHGAVGAWFAKEQRLPQELQEVIRYHHFPHLAAGSPRLVALIAAADHMANFHQRRGENPNGYDASENPGIAALEVAGVEDVSKRLESCADQIIADAAGDTREMLDFACPQPV